MKIDGGSASSAAPKPSPQPFTRLTDELPLRPARVLKFVHEDVAVARFDAQPALRKLVQVLQQLDGAFQDAGKVEQRVRFQRVLVLTQRHREDPPDAARHHGVQVAPESADGVGHERRQRRRRRPMPPPRVVRVAVRGVERRAREALAARFAVLREEIGAQAIDQMSKGACPRGNQMLRRPRVAQASGLHGRRLPEGCASIRRANKIANVRRQHRELRMMAGAVIQKPVKAVATRCRRCPRA